MKCPTDQIQMSEIDRNGVRVASCPECKGVWLAEGTLEKLIDAATSMSLHPDHFHQGRGGYDLLPSYDRSTHNYPPHELRPFSAKRSFFKPV